MRSSIVITVLISFFLLAQGQAEPPQKGKGSGPHAGNPFLKSGKKGLTDGNDKTTPLLEWLKDQTGQTVDLSEEKLKTDFDLTKEELSKPDSGFTEGTCSPEGCTFNLGTSLIGSKSVRITSDKKKGIKVATATDKAKFDEDGNRVIGSQKELEEALKAEKKGKVALLFSSSLKKDDKIYFPVKSEEKLLKSGPNNTLVAFDPSKEPAGKIQGKIYKQGPGNALIEVKNLVKGPFTDGDNKIPEGTLAEETSGKHCPPCRLLHTFMKPFKEAAPDTAVYVIDTGAFTTGPTQELFDLRNKYIKDLGWPNGVMFEKGSAGSSADMSDYKVSIQGNMKLPDHMIKTIYPGQNRTWETTANANVSQHQ